MQRLVVTVVMDHLFLFKQKLHYFAWPIKTYKCDFSNYVEIFKSLISAFLFQNERFRNRVVQTTFSTPGIKAPDTEISDDELLETLKKIIDERTNSFKNIKELEHKLKMADTNSKDFQKNVHDLRKGVQNAKVNRLI